jgi:hypothetical protein
VMVKTEGSDRGDGNRILVGVCVQQGQ